LRCGWQGAGQLEWCKVRHLLIACGKVVNVSRVRVLLASNRCTPNLTNDCLPFELDGFAIDGPRRVAHATAGYEATALVPSPHRLVNFNGLWCSGACSQIAAKIMLFLVS